MNPGILLVVEESATGFHWNRHKIAVNNTYTEIYSFYSL
jgi:hypothetical protein